SLESLLPETSGRSRIAVLQALSNAYGSLDLHKALTYGEEGLLLAQDLNEHQWEAAILYEMGKANLYFNKNYTGRDLFRRSLVLALHQKDAAAIGNAYNGIAYSFYGVDVLDSSVTYAFIARKFMNPQQSPVDYSYNCQLLGIVYAEMGDLEEGLKYLTEGLKYAETSGDKMRQAELCTHTGAAYIRYGQYDSAEKWVKKALKFYLDNNDTFGLYASYNALGRINYGKGNHDVAMEYYQKSLEGSKIRNDPYSVAVELNNIGIILLEQGEMKMAFDNFTNAIAIAREMNSIYLQRVTCENFNDYYFVNKNFGQATYYRNSYRSFFDSMNNQTIAEQVANMQVKYETGKKEKAIAEQKLLIVEKDSRIIRQRDTVAALIAALIVLIGGGWLFYNRYRLRQKLVLDAALIREQKEGLKAVIEAQDNERKRIAKDLHDGIAQQLVALKFGLARIAKKMGNEPPEQKSFLDDLVQSLDASCTDVRNISHVMAPRALEEKGLVPALENLFRLSLSGAGIQHEFEYSGMNHRLKENIETSIYLIAQELINNILKHSGATQVEVKLVQQQNELEMKVTDNGKGFDFEEAHQQGSMGLFNILSRVNILDGSFSANRLTNSGMEACIRIPHVA
ncbi:MAG: sensor histidine kinase, partial [Chitinophagales bacterium]